MTSRFFSRGARLAATVAAGAILIAACGSGTSTNEPVSDAPASSEAPAAAPATDAPAEPSLLNGVVPTVRGSQIDLAAFTGQDVLMWVWAPW